MGYDMSDSLFMQQQQAAGRDKESKRELEEKTALEAFRAAALQVCSACPARTRTPRFITGLPPSGKFDVHFLWGVRCGRLFALFSFVSDVGFEELFLLSMAH